MLAYCSCFACMIDFDLLIPTHWSLTPLEWLLHSVIKQSILPKRLILLVWKEHTPAALQTFSYAVHKICDSSIADISILHSHYSDHEQGRGVGYDRHFLVGQSTSDYLCMIDEDNILPDDFFSSLIQWYYNASSLLGHEVIVSPTIMRQGTIQSQWITGFSFLFPKYHFGRCSDRPWQEVMMIGANSLFGRRVVFQQIQFDPRFEGSYEDIDFSYRVGIAGYSVVVLRDVCIDHVEREKSFLESLFLWSPRSAYLRSRNRIRRVKKNASLVQKIQYFFCWLRLQTAGRIYYIFRYEKRQSWNILRAVWKGIVYGVIT